MSDDGRRRIIFQLWDWIDERRYTVHLYITRQTPAGWQTFHDASIYRALLRAELSGILAGAGFVNVRWLMPRESGVNLPPVIANTP